MHVARFPLVVLASLFTFVTGFAAVDHNQLVVIS